MKKTLWALAIIISFVFILSGAQSFLGNREKGNIGTINGKKISRSTFLHYIKMAQIYLILHSEEDAKVTKEDIDNLAIDFMLLTAKAQKEKIAVKDKEVIDYVVNNFFGTREFSQEKYQNFLNFLSNRYSLGLTVRSFEEHIRSFIQVNKLFAKHLDLDVTADEARDLYIKENQKAKIQYLLVSYENFTKDPEINQDEIEKFYDANKYLFKEEAKVNIRYIFIDEANESKDEIIAALADIKSLKSLEDQFSLKVKESGFMGLSDPIEGLGWQPQLNQVAFSLKEKQMSPLMKIDQGSIIIEKIAQKPASISDLSQITTEVKKKIIESRSKAQAQKYTDDVLGKINAKNLKNFKKIAAKDKNIEFKETDYFTFFDYIEGVGLDRNVSEVVFSLDINQIHSESLNLINGVYIIKLIELTSIDESLFVEEKDEYIKKLEQGKSFLERMKFLSQIRKEANLKISN